MSKEMYFVQEGLYWQTIQEATENAIVQVCAQIGEFDWLQPYQVRQQYEKRGSGFFIDKQGHFITNLHVVQHAKHVWIHIPALGQIPLYSDIIGVCPDRDIALLKISDDALNQINAQLEEICFLTFGDSDQMQKTESVLAMGYPLGQYNLKATTGVVSGREAVHEYSLIQITAPVNPGSSGGALLNVKGEVIGITVSIAPKSHNIGYAVPINELKTILKDLYTHRMVRKPFLGVRFVNCGDEKASFFSLPEGMSGLYVAKVFAGSLFHKMGVCEGDFLCAINDLALDQYGQATVKWAYDKVPFYDIISRMHIGEVIKINIFTKGKMVSMHAPLELHNPFMIRRRYPDYEIIEYEMIAGIIVMELAINHFTYLLSDSPELARFALPDFALSSALVVTMILPGSYAHQIGSINTGDIIISLNDIQVKTIAEWRNALSESIKTGYLLIKTDKNILSVLSVKKICLQEQELSESFAFPITQSVKKLLAHHIS